MKRIVRLLRGACGGLGDFLRREDGVSAVELALLLPVAFVLFGLAVFGGEGLGIQRKTTLAARTITDLVAQVSNSSSSSSGGCSNASSIAAINQSTLDYYLSLSSLVIYSYDSSQLTAEVSEVKVASAGATTATVVWSEAYNGGTARAQNSTVALSANLTSAVPGISANTPYYLLLGETQYSYTPVGIADVLGSMTISGSIFMTPRSVTSICVNWGS